MWTKAILIKLWTILVLAVSGNAHGALTVDRSRLILNQGEKSISLNVTNRNEKDPYLAQGWMEDVDGKKISGSLMVLPPVQRVEAGGKTLVRIQVLPAISSLPTDRESVFYLNLREIPPKSAKANVLTLAMQIRLKVFYRPKGLNVDPMSDTVPGTETLTLSKQGNQYEVHNPTPYHFSFVEVRRSLTGSGLARFEPVMVAPKSRQRLSPTVSELGSTPVLMFVSDYGSQRLLPFICNGNTCQAEKSRIPDEISFRQQQAERNES